MTNYPLRLNFARAGSWWQCSSVLARLDDAIMDNVVDDGAVGINSAEEQALGGPKRIGRVLLVGTRDC